MYSNRPALSNTFRKKINFYAAAIVGPRFRCGRGSRTGPFPCAICRPSGNSTVETAGSRKRAQISAIKKRAPASLEPVCFFMVGMARFERAASASRTLRSSQTEPHPVAREDITPKGYRMQAFFSKKFLFTHSLPSSLLPIDPWTSRQTFCAYQAIRL